MSNENSNRICSNSNTISIYDVDDNENNNSQINQVGFENNMNNLNNGNNNHPATNNSNYNFESGVNLNNLNINNTDQQKVQTQAKRRITPTLIDK